MKSTYTFYKGYLGQGLFLVAAIVGLTSCSTSQPTRTVNDGVYFDPKTDVTEREIKEEENLARIGGRYFEDNSELITEETVEYTPYEVEREQQTQNSDYVQWGEEEQTTVIVNNYSPYGYSPYGMFPRRGYFPGSYMSMSFGWGSPYYGGMGYSPWMNPFYTPYYGLYSPYYSPFYGYGGFGGYPYGGFYGHGIYGYSPYVYGKGVRGGVSANGNRNNLQRSVRQRADQRMSVTKATRESNTTANRVRQRRPNSSNIRTRNSVTRSPRRSGATIRRRSINQRVRSPRTSRVRREAITPTSPRVRSNSSMRTSPSRSSTRTRSIRRR